MVQAEGNERAFDDAVDGEGERGLTVHGPIREGLDAIADGRPDEAKQRARGDDGKRGDDRHGTFAREKAEIGRELDFVEAVESRRRDEPDDDAAKDAGLDLRMPMIAVVSMPRSLAQMPIAARKTTQPTVPASAATPSLSVSPMATPMAKSSGRLAKIALPEAAMICDTISGSHEKFALPTPSRMPATGSTETGSIMHLPIFWRREKADWKLTCGSVFVFGGEGADFLRRRTGERALGEVAARGEAQAADLRFHRGDRGEAHAEFVDTKADEDRHGVGIAGDAAADADGRWCACAPSMVCAMSRSTAGFSASTFGASFGWPRSIASVYCVRSLVPMEKKSASAAKAVAITATRELRP